MSGPPRPSRAERRIPDPGDEAIRPLLAGAGARPPVAAGDLAAMRDAARGEWAALVARRRAAGVRRRWASALLAAGVLLALALGWRSRLAASPAEPVATIALVRGVVHLDAPDRLAATGMGVRAGTAIDSGRASEAGRLALRLKRGASLRLDEATRIRIVSATRIELERGAVYLDSRPEGEAGRPVEITTRLGVVREIGTQFEVRLDADRSSELSVRVREGRVALALVAGVQSVGAGERLLARSDGSVVRESSARQGAEWAWIFEATPVPEFEGRSLRAFLDWACRELGWELRFADPALEREAETIRLHGTVEGLRPEQALDASLAGAGLGRRFDSGVLVVDRLAPQPGN